MLRCFHLSISIHKQDLKHKYFVGGDANNWITTSCLFTYLSFYMNYLINMTFRFFIILFLTVWSVQDVTKRMFYTFNKCHIIKQLYVHEEILKRLSNNILLIYFTVHHTDYKMVLCENSYILK